MFFRGLPRDFLFFPLPRWLANLQEVPRHAQTDTHSSVSPISVISNLHFQTLSSVSAGADSDLRTGPLSRFKSSLCLCETPHAIFKADKTQTTRRPVWAKWGIYHKLDSLKSHMIYELVAHRTRIRLVFISQPLISP